MAMRSNHGSINIQVTVKTSELLARLKNNRTNHAENYQRALSAWQVELEAALKTVPPHEQDQFPDILEQLRRDCPDSHVDEYDQAIDMFTMCTKEEITLDSESFNTFCRDEWGWKSYTSTNKFYQRARLR